MSFDMGFYLVDHRLITLGVIVLLAAAGEVGFRRGVRHRDSQDSIRSLMSGTGAAMLGLLGLLLGFTLSMALSRWDARRDVIVNEANAIGTLWLRAGLLEEPLRDDLRETLRSYTDARIALGGSRGDRASLRDARSESEAIHTTIWSAVERANGPDRSPAVLSSLITEANDVIDLHELRLASIENFLPAPLFLLLWTVSAISMGFLAWAFGAANQGGRTAVVMLGLLIGAVLLLIDYGCKPPAARPDRNRSRQPGTGWRIHGHTSRTRGSRYCLALSRRTFCRI